MRNRLVISLALGVLVAVLAAGVVGAQGLTDKGVSVDLGGGSSVTGEVLPACSNLRDDDGDGLVDLGDSGCSNPLDQDETNAAPPTTTTPTTPSVPTTPTDPTTTTDPGTTDSTSDPSDGTNTSTTGKDDPRDLPGTDDPFGSKGNDGEKDFSIKEDEGSVKDQQEIPTPE